MRPSSEDVRLAGDLLASETGFLDSGTEGRALLLGVTQELAAASWLRTFDLFAAERVRAMIDVAWPGNTPQRHVVCADWRFAPFPDESLDLVIGDGCLTVVDPVRDLPQLLAEVNRCLRTDGYLLLRLFCRPDAVETPEQVIAALLSGAIGSIHVFKWRLVMAVQGVGGGSEVSLRSVWEIWNEVREDAARVAETRGWPAAAVGTMELYRDSPASLSFMTFDATVRILREAGFALLATRTGTYELAERCPHVLLRKRGVGCGAPAA